MSLGESLLDVWRQALVDRSPGVTIGGRTHPVAKTRARGLAVVSFVYGDHAIEGIEQNPEKESRWAKLAQDGQRIMQFSCRRRYFANVCEGKVTRYPAWTSLGLPD